MISSTPPVYTPIARSSTDLRIASSHLVKPSAILSLVEPVVFLRPPSDDARASGTTRDPLASVSSEGRGAVVEGLLEVVTDSKRVCRTVVIRLVATLRVGNGSISWRDEEVLVREQVLRNVELVPGQINSFPFFLTLDSSAPASVEHSAGSIRYSLTATLKSGSLLHNRDLRASQTLLVVSDWAPRQHIDTRFTFHRRYLDPSLGFFELDLHSPSLILSSTLIPTLTLISPPPTLTIYGIHVYLRQTASLYPLGLPSKGTTPTSTAPSSRITLLEAGTWDRSWDTGFIERAKRAGGIVKLASETDLDGQPLWEESPWSWTGTGFLPSHKDAVEPSTAPGTSSRLRFGSELIIEVVHSRVDDPTGKPKSTIVLKTPIHLLSCQCSDEAMALPGYLDPSFPVPASNKLPACVCSHRPPASPSSSLLEVPCSSSSRRASLDSSASIASSAGPMTPHSSPRYHIARLRSDDDHLPPHLSSSLSSPTPRELLLPGRKVGEDW